nr:immunoglobulin light chain junction region [Macaca mulatta]MOW74601.1 immunoglobulin light chain junction region [Macaca mulatta]
CQQHYIYPYSF